MQSRQKNPKNLEKATIELNFTNLTDYWVFGSNDLNKDFPCKPSMPLHYNPYFFVYTCKATAHQNEKDKNTI